MKNRWDQIRWGSAQAGVSLSLASSGWLLSGLTPSPLINSLLPALTTLPALLPLKRRAGAFCWIVCGAVALLIVCSPAVTAVQTQLLVITVLMAGLMIALGQDMSQLPLQLQLLRAPQLNFPQLRRASEIGALLGFCLTGLIQPGVHQFIPAALLLLPLLPLACRSQANPLQSLSLPRFNREAALQGLLFGGFFGLLPLWVRSIAEGNCLNFGMVLAAYGLGRTLLNNKIPALQSSWHLYVVLGALLGLGQLLPGWMTTVLFLPIGTLAAATDRQLVARLMPNDPAQGWQMLQRSGSIGGLAGVLFMGGLAQWLGLPLSLGLQLVLFVTAPLLMRTIR